MAWPLYGPKGGLEVSSCIPRTVVPTYAMSVPEACLAPPMMTRAVTAIVLAYSDGLNVIGAIEHDGGEDKGAVGATVGVDVGAVVGSEVGTWVGAAVGAAVGVAVGVEDGADVGAVVGVAVGARVGAADGVTVGVAVGAAVGGGGERSGGEASGAFESMKGLRMLPILSLMWKVPVSVSAVVCLPSKYWNVSTPPPPPTLP